ncbi:hypothetical protein [Caldisalinibacter kiritimatiensis]|uniref:Uncharacterized protein n=1 Tax=Caldisalinibacter kiritimatiensis TaxID=1304284 RepID=R1AS42_9FIRM|nr:hypothetical protein [Caldisalinibacter kiritimatiensis]EOC99461.1 hypothetical protein L21TH_2466 [Caldisalinibacter kiritimatiensis]
MRKRLYLKSIEDNLAKDMWGDVRKKEIIFSGLSYYECDVYKGFICNDKKFNIAPRLKKKLNPMIILEVYRVGKERFILERTNKSEEIPPKVLKKFNNEEYEERINIYAFTESSMNILKYYHTEILDYIYRNNLDNSNKYSTLLSYKRNVLNEIVKYLALNAPEFVKERDKQRAENYLMELQEMKLNRIENEKSKKRNKIIKDIERVNDEIKQRMEMLCV